MANKPTGLINDKAIGAILGAACGDALGWPNERVARSKAKKLPHSRTLEFVKWSRRAGGRFYSHEEIIEVGQYSDDTQLILCLYRSLQCGTDWRKVWTEVELPFWTLYERGGGGATKRAANAWIAGNAPWFEGRNAKDVKKYFEAGGNGVAMRVLPHAIYHSGSDNYEIVAQNIMLDGIATHGHPRALVGALAYGYALWRALQRNERLEYGSIVSDLLENIKSWSPMPDLSRNCPDWQQSANQHFPNYQQLWEEAVQEIRSYLSVCKKELDKGALAIDDEVLRALKCFDRRVGGAGTVAAAAAVYLTSRYAPNPIQGMIKAAFAIGSDTDTIASMTGALLGTVCGSTWIEPYAQKVQDAKYLIQNANRLVSGHDNSTEGDLSTKTTISPVKKTDLNNLIRKLQQARQGDTIDLPDSRKAEVLRAYKHRALAKNVEAMSWQLKSSDGQSLYVKKISRKQQAAQGELWNQEHSMSATAEIDKRPRNVTRLGVKLRVQDLAQAREFYNRVLGLRVARETRNIVNLEGTIALVSKDYAIELNGSKAIEKPSHSILYIETHDFDRVFAAVRESGNHVMAEVTEWSGQRFFKCTDLDGNIIEVFDASYKQNPNSGETRGSHPS